MLKRKNVLFMAVAAAAIPVASQAAIVTLSFDMNDFAYSASKTPSTFVPLPAADLSGTSAAPVVTIPVGDYLEYGVDAQVTNNNGLGLVQFTVGVTDNTPSTAVIFSSNQAANTALAGVTIPSFFAVAPTNGFTDGSGGVLITGNGTSGAHIAAEGDSLADVTYGVAAPANLYSTMRIQTTRGNGTQAKFTLGGVKGGTSYLTQKTGTAGSTSATYISNTLGSADSFGAFPTLTINIGTASTTTTTAPSGHPVIALTNGAPTANYGTQLGHAITITGGFGNYTPGNTGLNTSSGVATGFTAVSTFTPANDVEVYALKLAVNNGAPLTTAQINAIIADINNASGPGGAGTAAVNVSAGAITGPYAALFPSSAGWDVLLTSTGGFTLGAGNGTAYSTLTSRRTPPLLV